MKMSFKLLFFLNISLSLNQRIITLNFIKILFLGEIKSFFMRAFF